MTNTKKYYTYYLLILILVAAASFYPLYMGVKVLTAMARDGAIPIEEYPKYVIPYTPIVVAVILGVLLIPVLQKLSRKFDLFWGSGIAVIAFFAAEWYMEKKVLVQTFDLVSLESWQMSLCYIPPQQYATRTWEAVDVLLGGYSPAFKLHFYLISVVIIVSLLNSFYGFAKMIRIEDTDRKTALVIQTVTAVLFLGMCIWACFTAFYRTGEITVSPLSAVLMAVFFMLLGVTMGVFAGSFLIGKKRLLSCWIPAAIALAVTTVMYIGEMILLSGNLYRFGEGVLFEGLGGLILAPIDILVNLMSGVITFLICIVINKES